MWFVFIFLPTYFCYACFFSSSADSFHANSSYSGTRAQAFQLFFLKFLLNSCLHFHPSFSHFVKEAKSSDHRIIDQVWFLSELSFQQTSGLSLSLSLSLRLKPIFPFFSTPCSCSQTQPVPNPMSYYMHRSPWWFHRFETLSNHLIELVFPFFTFLGRRMCMVNGAVQILFQVRLRPEEKRNDMSPDESFILRRSFTSFCG